MAVRACAAPLVAGALLAGCASEISDPAATGGAPNGSAGLGDPAAPGNAGTASGVPSPSGGANGGTMVPPGAGASPGSAGAGPTAACSGAPSDAGASVLRRLSALEYQLTVQDLFQLPSPPDAEGIPVDTAKDGFTTFAEVQTVSPQHLRAYLDKATELADALLADTARRARVLGCEPSAQGCLRSFVTRFGELAYRRALEPEEIDSLVQRAESDALDTTDQFRFVIQALLTSTSFLYRMEVGDKPEGLATLSGVELASRLSFGLWGRAPSAELLEQAERGALDTPEGFSSVVSEMLSDPKAQRFFSAFFRQWLGFDALRAPTTPPAGWSGTLLGDMQAETDGVLQEFAWTGKNFLDALTTNRTKVSPGLAKFFGLPSPAADGTVEFPAGHVRANTGILTHPALISAKGDGDLIARRGNWLRQTFLCKHMEIPAALQEQIGETLVGLSPVQIVEKRNTEAACRGCHALIDPIGIGFSEFDNLGRYDEQADITKYGIAPALPDAAEPEFASVAELAAKLREIPGVSECLAHKLFIYVNGREATEQDACTVQAAAQAFAAGSQQFPALVKGLVEVPAFRMRRAPAATP